MASSDRIDQNTFRAGPTCGCSYFELPGSTPLHKTTLNTPSNVNN
jgi:hypothetical protein